MNLFHRLTNEENDILWAKLDRACKPYRRRNMLSQREREMFNELVDLRIDLTEIRCMWDMIEMLKRN